MALDRLRIQHPAIASDLRALPTGLPLRELALDNQPDRRGLAGVGRWRTLTRVAVRGAPLPEETAELATLPALRALDVHAVDTADAGQRAAELRRALPSVEVRIFTKDR